MLFQGLKVHKQVHVYTWGGRKCPALERCPHFRGVGGLYGECTVEPPIPVYTLYGTLNKCM